MRSIRPRTVLAPFAAGCLATLALLLATYALAAADTGGTPPPDATERWRATGMLAGPVAIGAYALLRLLLVAGHRRGRAFAFLRRPQMLAVLSTALAAVSVLLPAAAAGSLTWGGALVGVLTSGALALPGTAPAPEVPT